jgi:diaminopimelate epimerase
MSDVKNVKLHPKHVFLDTGSPHHIEFVDDTDAVDVQERGRVIAHHVDYGDEGTNVNFVSIGQGSSISVRTFERGVENETLSCGTGVTAAAIAAFATRKVSNSKIDVTTLGGELTVSFVLEKKLYRDVVLTGPAQLVFSGTLNI